MSLVTAVQVPRRPASLLEPLIGRQRYLQLTQAADQVRAHHLERELDRDGRRGCRDGFEGFGLTVSEGMWKGRPVVGSAVGGIIDQIADGTGILLPDPADLQAFGRAVSPLLGNQAQATRLGLAAHAYVREHYIGDIHLVRYAQLLGTLNFEDLSPGIGSPTAWRADQ